MEENKKEEKKKLNIKERWKDKRVIFLKIMI